MNNNFKKPIKNETYKLYKSYSLINNGYITN